MYKVRIIFMPQDENVTEWDFSLKKLNTKITGSIIVVIAQIPAQKELMRN